jgi:hypothetical protein
MGKAASEVHLQHPVERDDCRVRYSDGTRRRSLGEEHPELYSDAAGAIVLLRGVSGNLGSIDGASVWSHHLEFAERASQLADHLDAALELAPGHVASAFALLRTAMEHACVDELLLLADRYREYTRVDEATFAVLQAEFEAGEADWTRNVVAFDRTRNGGSLVRTGHPVVDTDGNTVEQLSPYYPVLEHHDAILGPPASQSDLAEPFSDPDRLREWARRNRGLHQNYLQWRAIGDNLVLNGRFGFQRGVTVASKCQFGLPA